MAQWMDQHFQTSAPAAVAPKPKPRRWGFLAVLLVLLAIGGVLAAWTLGLVDDAPVRAAIAKVAPATPADTAPILPPEPFVPSRPPANAPAPAPAAPAAKPPSGLDTLIERVVEVRRDRAAHLRWLDECEQKGFHRKAQAEVASAQDAAKWSAQTRLNNLLADIKSHQQEVARLDDMCDSREERLLAACAKTGFQCPNVENPQTTYDHAALREKKRPELGPVRLVIRHQ